MPWKEKASAAVQFLKEVRMELRKVNWPKREDVIRATIMTLAATLIVALYLGFTDYMLLNGIRPLFVGRGDLWTFLLLAYFGVILYVVYLTTKE